jgi:hypothetical protein
MSRLGVLLGTISLAAENVSAGSVTGYNLSWLPRMSRLGVLLGTISLAAEIVLAGSVTGYN